MTAIGETEEGIIGTIRAIRRLTAQRETMVPPHPPPTTPIDEAAQLRAAQSDLAQFLPIYERYFPRIYAYCWRRVGNAQEAEDLVSHIFTSAMTNLSGYRGGLVAAWLFRIAHNAVINHLRSAESRRLPLSLDLLPETPAADHDPIERLIEAEAHARVRDLVAQLPAVQQDLLLLRVVGGLTAEEIGAVLGKRAGAIRVTLHRLLRHLQDRYRLSEGGTRHD